MDSVSARAVVPGGRKARLLARALLVAASESASQEHPVMPECRFLVDAVEQNNRYDDLVPEKNRCGSQTGQRYETAVTAIVTASRRITCGARAGRRAAAS